ncbi:MAG: hypothetical protein ACI8PT_003001 [Gammaproteobacteria bacterium]|jgi:hypothetical protein
MRGLMHATVLRVTVLGVVALAGVVSGRTAAASCDSDSSEVTGCGRSARWVARSSNRF